MQSGINKPARGAHQQMSMVPPHAQQPPSATTNMSTGSEGASNNGHSLHQQQQQQQQQSQQSQQQQQPHEQQKQLSDKPASAEAAGKKDDKVAPVRKRLSLACTTCRQRKVKCDGGRPSCRTCAKFNWPCIYQPSNRKRGPRPRALALMDGALPYTNRSPWSMAHSGYYAYGFPGQSPMGVPPPPPPSFASQPPDSSFHPGPVQVDPAHRQPGGYNYDTFSTYGDYMASSGGPIRIRPLSMRSPTSPSMSMQNRHPTSDQPHAPKPSAPGPDAAAVNTSPPTAATHNGPVHAGHQQYHSQQPYQHDLMPRSPLSPTASGSSPYARSFRGSSDPYSTAHQHQYQSQQPPRLPPIHATNGASSSSLPHDSHGQYLADTRYRPARLSESQTQAPFSTSGSASTLVPAAAPAMASPTPTPALALMADASSVLGSSVPQQMHQPAHPYMMSPAHTEVANVPGMQQPSGMPISANHHQHPPSSHIRKSMQIAAEASAYMQPELEQPKEICGGSSRFKTQPPQCADGDPILSSPLQPSRYSYTVADTPLSVPIPSSSSFQPYFQHNQPLLQQQHQVGGYSHSLQEPEGYMDCDVGRVRSPAMLSAPNASASSNKSPLSTSGFYTAPGSLPTPKLLPFTEGESRPRLPPLCEALGSDYRSMVSAGNGHANVAARGGGAPEHYAHMPPLPPSRKDSFRDEVSKMLACDNGQEQRQQRNLYLHLGQENKGSEDSTTNNGSGNTNDSSNGHRVRLPPISTMDLVRAERASSDAC